LATFFVNETNRFDIFLPKFFFVSSACTRFERECRLQTCCESYNDKLYDLALEQFHAFISLYPNTAQGVEAHFYLGLTQSKLGKHDEARFTFQNFALAYSDNSKAPEAWMNAAEEICGYERMNARRQWRLNASRRFIPKSKFAPSRCQKAADYYEKTWR